MGLAAEGCLASINIPDNIDCAWSPVCVLPSARPERGCATSLSCMAPESTLHEW